MNGVNFVEKWPGNLCAPLLSGLPEIAKENWEERGHSHSRQSFSLNRCFIYSEPISVAEENQSAIETMFEIVLEEDREGTSFAACHHLTLDYPVELEHIVMTGNINISSEPYYEGTMTAPSGAVVVNPLTSLIDQVIQSGALSTQQAIIKVLAKLGLPGHIDPLNFDPLQVISHPDSSIEQTEAAIKIHTIMAKIDFMVERIASFLRNYLLLSSKEEAISSAYSALGDLLIKGDEKFVRCELSSLPFVQSLLAQAGRNAGAKPEYMEHLASFELV